ncbi:threonine/homoserine/homoserine lactone efflux protein [Bradyrhizobium diazoefficiens]
MQNIEVNTQTIAIAALVVGAVIVYVAAHYFLVTRPRRRRIAGEEAELAARELAIIVEDVRLTAGGIVAAVLLVVTILYSFVTYEAATTVFQQIASGVSLIAGCIVWGLGVALGRRRTYRVLRSEHRQPM